MGGATHVIHRWDGAKLKLVAKHFNIIEDLRYYLEVVEPVVEVVEVVWGAVGLLRVALLHWVAAEVAHLQTHHQVHQEVRYRGWRWEGGPRRLKQNTCKFKLDV